jgi:hypothetical protein
VNPIIAIQGSVDALPVETEYVTVIFDCALALYARHTETQPCILLIWNKLSITTRVQVSAVPVFVGAESVNVLLELSAMHRA